MTLRFPVDPMKGVLGSLPGGGEAGRDDDWAYEIKYDGFRTLAFVGDAAGGTGGSGGGGGRLRLQSSNRLDVTGRYPELAGLPDAVHAGGAILDGEMVVLDDEGRPRFELIQRHEREAAFYVFDVLSIGEHDTIGLPYEDRRRLLMELVEPGDNWAVPSHRVGGGAELLAATAAQGLEGVMAKRLGSVYRPGARSKDWIKVKNRIRVDLVIGGFTAGTGNRSSTFGALLVGEPGGDGGLRFADGGGGGLRFAGGVGTGFSQQVLESLRSQLDALVTAECPFDPPPPRSYARDATWVRPDLTATFEIAEFTNDGLVRHASFLSLSR